MENQAKYQQLPEVSEELSTLFPVIAKSLEAGNKDKRRYLELRDAVNAALDQIAARHYDAARVTLESVRAL